MELNTSIENCRKFYETAHDLKNAARVSDRQIDKFKEAAEYYQKAFDVITSQILKHPNLNHSEAVQGNALSHYYTYEHLECLYAYHYKKQDFVMALKYAQDGEVEIKKALEVIDENTDPLDRDIAEFLDRSKREWTSCEITIKIRKLEPIAKEAMIQKDYIHALDTFSHMLRIQKELLEYTEAANLDQVRRRIAAGNYIGMAANVSQAMAGIISTKVKSGTFNFNLSNDLLKHFLTSLELSLNAFEANPEWDLYRSGAESIRTNIQILLNQNKERWFDYLISNSNNKDLIRIMQQTDNDLFKRERAKLELQNNKTKRFLVTGLFWILLLFCVVYLLLQVATSNISWFRFLGIMLAVPIISTIFGAFVLRSTDSLKEDNFIELMSLALKINLQGIKVLSKKDEIPKA